MIVNCYLTFISSREWGKIQKQETREDLNIQFQYVCSTGSYLVKPSPLITTEDISVSSLYVRVFL